VQFAMVSDRFGSEYFPGRADLTMPVFQDDSSNRAAWRALKTNALKHDTFVFNAQGVLVLSWTSKGLLDADGFKTDIAAAVRALPP
jgi:hypothetical protein